MRDGVVIAGRYHIRRPAGSGGMGTVYEAWDDARGMPVAVKAWRFAPEGDPRGMVRLSREALALSEVHHPAVVRYIDHGTTAEHGPFLVIEWVPGRTLASRISSTGLTPREALSLTARLAQGLSALHSSGIVHRDLKPSNVMLPAPDPGSAVIVDLGVARLGGESDVTRTGAHLGTPRYMAPEQIRSARTVDGRADVFALGCILLEALTARPAFEGVEPVSVLAKILFERAPSPCARRPELPPELDGLVGALLEREPRRRPTASEVVLLIEQVTRSVSAEAWVRLAALASSGRELEPTPPGSTRFDDEQDAGAPPSFRISADAARITARRALQRPGGPLIGRSDERARLSALLSAGTRIVTVWGGPGVGKTRLVGDVVRDLVEASAPPAWDTLVHGDLSDARDADDVVRILAREAGVSLEPSLAPEVALGRAFSRLGRVLLIADPVDHVASAFAASVGAWKGSAPHLQVVAVSRARFCPPGAIAVEVGPLSMEAAAGTRSAAAALLFDRAEHFMPGLTSAATDLEKNAQAEVVVQFLAGVPQAIELYAARISVLGLSGLLAPFGGASGSSPTLDMNQGAMRSAIAWSWNLLRPAEESALVQCAAFHGGFDAAAARDVIRVDGDGAAVLDLLKALREKSLLSSSSAEAGAEPRLSMLPAVREFAAEKLRASPAEPGVLARHAAHYARIAGPFANGAPSLPFARLEREAENLLAAAEFAVSGEAKEPSSGLSCLLALEPAMLARGAVGSYRALLDRAVDGAREGDAADVRRLRAKARQSRARIDAPGGGLARARADLGVCLEEARLAGDAHFEATVRVDLGVAHHLSRALPDAKRCYEAALELLAPLDDVAAEGRAIGNLGALAHDEGALSEAAQLYRKSIALLEEAGEAPRRANFMANLALVEQELGRSSEARELYERAVTLLEPVRDARLLAIAVGNFGVLELDVREPARALALFERSQLLLSGSGDRRSEAICLSRIGAALALLGRPDDAEARLFRAERLAAKASDPVALEAVTLVRAVIALCCARLATDARDRVTARAHLDEAKRGVDRAVHAVHAGRPVTAHSDDVRATLRVIERLLPEAEARLTALETEPTS